jgi:hypothetical protein
MAYRKQYRKAGGGENGINVNENGMKAKQLWRKIINGIEMAMADSWQWLMKRNRQPAESGNILMA